MEDGEHPAWRYGGAPSVRPTEDSILTGNRLLLYTPINATACFGSSW